MHSMRRRRARPGEHGTLLLRATSIGLIATATPLHPPGAPEVDASSQPERHDRALSNRLATPGQAAVPDEAVGACSRSVPAGTIKLVPRSSDAAARRATVSDPDVALLSSPRRTSATRCTERQAVHRHDADGLASLRRTQAGSAIGCSGGASQRQAAQARLLVCRQGSHETETASSRRRRPRQRYGARRRRSANDTRRGPANHRASGDTCRPAADG